MRREALNIALAGGFALLVVAAIGQELQAPTGHAGQNATQEQRAAATRIFLGLGAAPDKVAAARAAPIYQQTCSFCHGPQARGASGPNLITSDVVLGDNHGEHLAPFLKKGRPEKGMPSFAQLPENELIDLAEFLHQQVEDVANRGAYHLQNIVVGDAAQGRAYVKANCMACHSDTSFDHIAGKFRTPDQLQRSWIWPSRPADSSLAIRASVKSADGAIITGRVTQLSDFRVTVVPGDGRPVTFERGPGVDVKLEDPLAPHQAIVMTLKNDDMHNVTAYLETLR